MKVTLSEFHEAASCTWCEREIESVSATFESGFLTDAPMCWKCLQKAVRVYHRQQTKSRSKRSSSKPKTDPDRLNPDSQSTTPDDDEPPGTGTRNPR